MESKHSSESSNNGAPFLTAVLSSHTNTTPSKNMVASHSLYHSLDPWNAIQKKIGSFLFLLLVLSTIFLLSILYSSNTYDVTTKYALLKESSVSENSSPPETKEAVLINASSLATTRISRATGKKH